MCYLGPLRRCGDVYDRFDISHPLAADAIWFSFVHHRKLSGALFCVESRSASSQALKRQPQRFYHRGQKRSNGKRKKEGHVTNTIAPDPLVGVDRQCPMSRRRPPTAAGFSPISRTRDNWDGGCLNGLHRGPTTKRPRASVASEITWNYQIGRRRLFRIYGL